MSSRAMFELAIGQAHVYFSRQGIHDPPDQLVYAEALKWLAQQYVALANRNTADNLEITTA